MNEVARLGQVQHGTALGPLLDGQTYQIMMDVIRYRQHGKCYITHTQTIKHGLFNIIIRLAKLLNTQ